MSEDLTMWDMWRRDYRSPKDAVEEHYPNTLANDPVLRHALAQIETGELALNARMQQLADQEEEDE